MKIQRCKGMRDLSPGEMKIFRLVEGICRDVCCGWGYSEVRTPTIEYLHLFTSAGTLTPGRLGKVYSFLDWDGWSGERVVLRPDGTIPVARMYAESMQGMARLFYAANLFMFESGGDENRETWQCGAELIGAGSAMADAELIALSLEVLKKLGLKGVELRLSHAGLIKALLVRLGLTPEEQGRMFDRILDGDAAALAEISRKSPDIGDTIKPFLGLKGQAPGFLRNQRALLARSMPEICQPLDDFLQTVALLDELGIKYQINVASGAGFEYYTGIIFQYFIDREKVGGGGRYDALIPSMGGGDVPASGFALYLDRLMDLVSPEIFIKTEPVKVLIRVKPNGTMKDAFNMAGKLREAGYIVELDLDGKEVGYRWIVEVGGAAAFTIVDTPAKKRTEASSVKELLKLLEGEGGD